MLGIFEIGSCGINCPGLALNCDPPDLCLLKSWDYRHELLVPSSNKVLLEQPHPFIYISSCGCFHAIMQS
jgi:hypothetical protein